MRKRWRVVTTVLVVSLAVALVITIRMPKTYEATCSLVIDSTAPQVLEGVKEVIEMADATREFYNTQYRIIRSHEVAQQVIDRLGLSGDATYFGSGAASQPANRNLMVERLLKKVKVLGVRDSHIANIQVSDVESREPHASPTLSPTFISNKTSISSWKGLARPGPGWANRPWTCGGSSRVLRWTCTSSARSATSWMLVWTTRWV